MAKDKTKTILKPGEQREKHFFLTLRRWFWLEFKLKIFYSANLIG